MKKQLLFTFFILLFVGCNSSKRFYNSGYVNSKNDIDKIEFLSSVAYEMIEALDKITNKKMGKNIMDLLW